MKTEKGDANEPQADITETNIEDIKIKVFNEMERKRREALIRELKKAEKELLEETKPQPPSKKPRPPGGAPKLPGRRKRRR